MTKLRKQRKRKTYNYGRNRQRVRKQQERTTKFNVKVDCKAMKDEWDHRFSVRENMASMGVVFQAKEIMPLAGSKKTLVKKMKKQKNINVTDEKKAEVTKPEVLERIVDDAASVPVKQSFRFTATQVQLITHMMKKHGTDYKAMARDPKNHYQETPAKLKGMISKFISIPEQYAVYCKDVGLIVPSISMESSDEVKPIETPEVESSLMDESLDEEDGDGEEEDVELDVVPA